MHSLHHRLEGLSVLVIGAGCLAPTEMGIGKAISLRLAAEGAQMFLADIDLDAAKITERDVIDQGGTAHVFECDASQGESLRELVADCERIAPIDVLIFNAATGVPEDPVSLTEKSWDQTYALNVRGFFLASKYALPGMLRAGSGNFIAISSLAAIRYPGYPHIAYGSSKAALIQYVRYLALEYAARGVRANSILPGLMETPRLRRMTTAWVDDGDLDRMLEVRANLTPMKRGGQPHDIAAAAAFLASPDSAFVSGTELIVDGGMSAKFGPMAGESQG